VRGLPNAGCQGLKGAITYHIVLLRGGSLRCLTRSSNPDPRDSSLLVSGVAWTKLVDRVRAPDSWRNGDGLIHDRDRGLTLEHPPCPGSVGVWAPLPSRSAGQLGEENDEKKREQERYVLGWLNRAACRTASVIGEDAKETEAPSWRADGDDLCYRRYGLLGDVRC
jgi:hypothetical protein